MPIFDISIIKKIQMLSTWNFAPNERIAGILSCDVYSINIKNDSTLSKNSDLPVD